MMTEGVKSLLLMPEEYESFMINITIGLNWTENEHMNSNPLVPALFLPSRAA